MDWKNQGRPTPLSEPGTLAPGSWHLVELHRGVDRSLRCVISGKDVTVGSPQDELPFVFMFLFNHNKGQGFAGQDPFAGDVAALAIFRTELPELDRKRVRDYFGRVYQLDRSGAANQLDRVHVDGLLSRDLGSGQAEEIPPLLEGKRAE